MKWNRLFSLRLSEIVTQHVQKNKQLELLVEKDQLQQNITNVIEGNFKKEEELDREVEEMMDDLESQGHEFERYKMRPLVKSQLAKKKGFVL